MDSDVPRPPQRKVLARVLTPSGWLVARFHVPEAQPFVDFLEEDKGFFTLTDVELLSSSARLPFLALARSAAILIIPGDDDNLAPPARTSARTELRTVSVLFPGGLLMGQLPLPENARVSDELMASTGFLLLGQCTLGFDVPEAGPSVEANPIVIVQAARLIGVSEL